MSFVNSISATKTAQVMSKIDTTGAGVSIAGELDATAIGATLNGVLSQNFATNTELDNKFVADQHVPLINPYIAPFTWNDIATQNFVNTRNFLTLDDVYPIGSIYFTASSVQPGTSLGGIWVRYAQGKCLFGVDDYDSDFSSVEQIGGVKDVVLTEAQMPSHTHTLVDNYRQLTQNGAIYHNDLNHKVFTATTPGSAVDTTSATGGGQAHENLPPYIAIHIWKRIA